MANDHLWWQTGIIYQVYPRSYMDSNGDGVGDLNGITSKLDYLKWLGVHAVWISPIFRSPMNDFGYDVADYCDIDPLFGTMGDFDRLLEEAHSRGLKVILDYVPNHSSHEHPWFVESRSSRDNPKRDWYVWRDALEDGSPPNNWLAHFGGRAWTWDEATEQYYLHSFLPEQPDLNWRNAEVRNAMLDVLRFWLGKGVDGFRVDVIYAVMKDPEMRDNPPNPEWKEGDHPFRRLIPSYSLDHPDIHEVVAEMRAVFDEYDERVMIGEVYLPIDRLVRYYGDEDKRGCHLPFNFQLVTKPWHAETLAASINRYEAALPGFGWPNWVLGNHDRDRIATRAGRPQARVAAMLILTLRGTPTLYQGDEIWMENVDIPPDRIVDPPGVNIGQGRDPERTPMQWSAGPNAGFTTASQAWLPVAPDYQQYNVEVERDDRQSMLSLHRRLITLRQSEDALMIGSYRPVPVEGDLLVYIREHEGRRFLVALNFSSEDAEVDLPGDHHGRIELSTHLDREGDEVRDVVELRENEGVVVRLA